MKELLGKTISEVYISEDKLLLLFVEKNSTLHAYNTSADCCADCWFESVNNVEAIIDSEIIGVEEKEIKFTENDQENHHDNTQLDIMGYTLKSLKGYCDVEFRNASNGYYQGHCERVSSHHKLSLNNREGIYYLRTVQDAFLVDREDIMRKI